MTHFACGWSGTRRESLRSPVREEGRRRREGAVRALASVCRAMRVGSHPTSAASAAKADG